MTPDEREPALDLGDELPVNPGADFEKYDPPAGTYQAAIAFVKYERRPDSEERDPGLNQARVTYRLEDPNSDPKYHGVLVSGYGKNQSMLTNGGRDKCYGWMAWLKTLGFDHESPPKASELMGLPVTIRTSTREGKGNSAGRTFVTVEQVWKREL